VAAFLIAYDIAHPRRLRRVARALERRAVRCQYSVFLFDGTETELSALLATVGELIRPTEDVVQAWPVPPGVLPAVFAQGAVRHVRPAGVVVSGRQPLFIALPSRTVPRPNPDSSIPSEDP
jgi:CRISPR-associated protein Cas2